jgi:hypothetical protein
MCRSARCRRPRSTASLLVTFLQGTKTAKPDSSSFGFQYPLRGFGGSWDGASRLFDCSTDRLTRVGSEGSQGRHGLQLGCARRRGLRRSIRPRGAPMNACSRPTASPKKRNGPRYHPESVFLNCNLVFADRADRVIEHHLLAVNRVTLRRQLIRDILRGD